MIYISAEKDNHRIYVRMQSFNLPNVVDQIYSKHIKCKCGSTIQYHSCIIVILICIKTSSLYLYIVIYLLLKSGSIFCRLVSRNHLSHSSSVPQSVIPHISLDKSVMLPISTSIHSIKEQKVLSSVSLHPSLEVVHHSRLSRIKFGAAKPLSVLHYSCYGLSDKAHSRRGTYVVHPPP